MGHGISDDITEDELKREERRALFLLGLLAIVVTARVGAHEGDTLQVSGFGWPLVAFLNILIAAWFGYAACMLIFFSDDFFSWRVGKWGKWKVGNVVRRLAKTVGHGLAFIPGLFILWIIGSLGAALSLPPPFFALVLLAPLWIPIGAFFVVLYRYVASKTPKRKGTGK